MLFCLLLPLNYSVINMLLLVPMTSNKKDVAWL